ncbi:restriction endonuclease subunit S [Microcella frigidaquae]|uniref:Type I restriction modification DNA specificity domain-containing protein n=1 Tax=Microcella frigidaquae TaxID=424758 RepID=A0A840X344_9MICO|nr:restriction endonuclease subunit S [Microcella frigidaquae]MBB5616913.1 hypothetical protein [Microcella frigidaquae]NHN43648.1 hypothetical protein [Microcella frigidaquae]
MAPASQGSAVRPILGLPVRFASLGEVADIANSGVDKKLVEGQAPVRLLNFMDVYRNTRITSQVVNATTTAPESRVQATALVMGDVVVTPTSESIDDLARSAVVVEDIPNLVYSYHVMRLRPDRTIIDSSFLSYLFGSRGLQTQIRAAANGITRFGLTRSKWESLRVPLPPIEVQRDVVRKLDSFTRLEAEIQGELALRKVQVAHYRRSSIALAEGTYPSVALEDVFDMRTGYTPSRSEPRNWTDGSVPWFRLEDIRERGRILEDSFQHVTTFAVKGGRLFPADSLLMSTIATIGEHALVRVPHLANQQFISLSVNSKFESLLDKRYLFHLAFGLGEWCRKNTTGSSLPMVRMVDFKKVPVPIPPLSIQRAVAEPLDRFEELIVNLGAELAARRKQYEYYRDKLLTFEEAPA